MIDVTQERCDWGEDQERTAFGNQWLSWPSGGRQEVWTERSPKQSKGLGDGCQVDVTVAEVRQG